MLLATHVKTKQEKVGEDLGTAAAAQVKNPRTIRKEKVESELERQRHEEFEKPTNS